ncbi:MAG: ABC transporter permease [bacterium]
MTIPGNKRKQIKTNLHSRLWYQFWQHKRAIVGLICIGVLVAGATFSDLITKYDPNLQGDLLTSRYLPPSLDHPFGTDKFSRDVFSRVLYGGRISLTIAISVVLLSMTLGLISGTVSGYIGGVLDAIVMRILDFLLAFPSIFLIITIVAVFHASHWYLIPVLSFTGWMETARIVRAEVLSLKERDFILAAKGLGLSHTRILIRHIIPNCLSPVIVAATLKVGEVILLESALSFLGIGVQPPTPSWGNIINDGREALLRAWWVATFPGLFIVTAVMSFNLIGDGLRECLNPRT